MIIHKAAKCLKSCVEQKCWNFDSIFLSHRAEKAIAAFDKDYRFTSNSYFLSGMVMDILS